MGLRDPAAAVCELGFGSAAGPPPGSCSTSGPTPWTAGSCTGRCTSGAGRCWPPAVGSGRRGPPLGPRGDRACRRDGRPVGPVRGAAGPASVALLRHDAAPAVPDLLPVWEHCEEHGIDEPERLPRRPGPGRGAGRDPVTLRPPSRSPTGSRRSRTRRTTLGPGHRAARGGDGAALGGQGGRRRPLTCSRRLTVSAPGPAVRRRAHPALPRPGPAPGPSVGAARETLETAAAAFDELGSTGWAADARGAVRVGARKPAGAGELTATGSGWPSWPRRGWPTSRSPSLVVTVNTGSSTSATPTQSWASGRGPSSPAGSPRPRRPRPPASIGDLTLRVSVVSPRGAGRTVGT